MATFDAQGRRWHTCRSCGCEVISDKAREHRKGDCSAERVASRKAWESRGLTVLRLRRSDRPTHAQLKKLGLYQRHPWPENRTTHALVPDWFAVWFKPEAPLAVQEMSLAEKLAAAAAAMMEAA